jgi:hypothetical protein
VVCLCAGPGVLAVSPPRPVRRKNHRPRLKDRHHVLPRKRSIQDQLPG